MSFNSKEARSWSSFYIPNRKLRFVSVFRNLARISYGFNLNIRQANLAECVFHVIALQLKLVLIGYMTVDTAAAGFGSIAKALVDAVL